MPGFPLPLLYRRLDNEEKELLKLDFVEILSKEDTCDLSTDVCKHVTKETIAGQESFTVVRKYVIRIRAKGYEKTPAGEIIPRNTHEFELYILRNYPLVSTSKTVKLGAPIRIVWLTPIFHPNIMSGPKASMGQRKGIVCWKMLQEWLPTMSLKDVVIGIKQLIENPNPDDAILSPETREAALWFSDKRENQ